MKKILIAFAIASVLASCKAGDGGDATVVVSPKHHGVPILSTSAYRDSVFIKFNATDLPENPTTNYDLLFVGTPGEAIIKCDGLKAGKYFIYATGWDPAVSQRVVGGVALKIKYKERKDELAVEVPVVE